MKEGSNPETAESSIPVQVSILNWKLHPKLASLNDPEYFVRDREQWKSVFLVDPRTESVPNNFVVYDATNLDIVYPIESFSKFRGSEHIQFSEHYMTILSKSFLATQTESGKEQTKLIFEYICETVHLYRSKANFYAPMSSICQSSGFGKSRGVSECGRWLPAIYGVFRKSSESGYPKQPYWIHRFYDYITFVRDDDFPHINPTELSCVSCNTGRVLIFIEALLKAYRAWLQNILQINPNMASEQQLARAFAIITEQFESGDNLDFFENNIILDESIRSPNIVAASISALSLVLQGYSAKVCHSFDIDAEVHPFVLILDEASVLIQISRNFHLDALNIIRRAAHWIEPNSSFLIITIGTNSDVASFHVAVQEDSLRFVDRKNLLPPLILTGNWDIFYDELQLDQLQVDKDLIMNVKTMLLLLTFGRPLWSSINIVDLMNIVQAKLKNGDTIDLDISLSKMAIWCIRSGLTINANLLMARELVKSYMATLVSISYDAEEMYVTYSSEPALAIAARKVLQGQDQEELLFKTLLYYCQGIPLDRGRITEAVFSEILLKAVDKSDSIANVYDKNPNGNDFTKKIFSVEQYILEVQEPIYPIETPEPELEPQQLLEVDVPEIKSATASASSNATGTVEISPVEVILNDQLHYMYHVSTVGSFLKKLYGDVDFEQLLPFLPERLLGGLVNCSQFIQLYKDFPFIKCFGKRVVGDKSLPNASEIGKGCNIIDKALLVEGIIRQVGFTMPANSFGFDSIIPVLLEIVENGRKRTIFTFIGIQCKAGSDHVIKVMTKMEARLHYVTDPKAKNVKRPKTSSTEAASSTSSISTGEAEVTSASTGETESTGEDKSPIITSLIPPTSQKRQRLMVASSSSNTNLETYDDKNDFESDFESEVSDDIYEVMSEEEDDEEDDSDDESNDTEPGADYVVSTEDINDIFENQLTLFMSAEDADSEEYDFASASTSTQTTHTTPGNQFHRTYSVYPSTQNKKQPLKSLFPQLPEFYQIGAKTALSMPNPKDLPYPADSRQPVKFGKYALVNLNENVSVCRMGWNAMNEDSRERVQTCIWSKNVSVFRGLMGERVVDLAKKIIRYDHDVFLHSEELQIRSVYDSFLNTQFAPFPEADRSLRRRRGFSKLPLAITNFSHWDTGVEKAIQKYSKKHPEKKDTLFRQYFLEQ